MNVDEIQTIVIGSGVCGALIAYRLAKRGQKVLILEAGPDNDNRVDFAGTYAATLEKHPGSPYSKAAPGYVVGPDNDPIYYEQATSDKFKSTFLRIVGGSTWHFLGNVPRFVPNDFRLKDIYNVGINWPIGYDDLESYYCEAERELGVSGDHNEWHNYLGAWRSSSYPMNKIWQSYGDQLFLRKVNGAMIGAKELKIMSTPQARNSTAYDGRPACAGNSSCVPICPIQAKYDATVHVKKAKAHGAMVLANCVVKKLHCEDGNEITKLTYADLKSKSDGVIDTRGKLIIVAANAIETPRLLLYSGIANRSEQVGKNLMDHLQGYCVALAKDPVFPFRGPLTTSGIDVFRDGEERKDAAAFRLSIGNDGWGRIEAPVTTLWNHLQAGALGKKLRTNVADRVTRMIRISFSTEMLPEERNAISLSPTLQDELGLPRPKLSFYFGDYNKRALAFAYEISNKIFQLAECIVDSSKGQFKDYSGAGHIMGTTRMGDNPEASVVDCYGKSHDHPNLFIAGPSVFPTSGTANPTLTAAALALRTADRLLSILSK